MPQRYRRLLIALLFVAGVGAGAAWLVHFSAAAPLLRVDAGLRDLARTLGAGSLGFWRAVTRLGATVVLWPLVAGLAVTFLLARRRGDARLLLETMLGALALEQTLKLLFHRARPEALWGDALPLTYSFPSGHALLFTCFALVVGWLLTRGRGAPFRAAVLTLAGALALLVGLSRIYLGVHFASDVAGGHLIALLWLLALRRARLVPERALPEPGTV